MAGEAIFIGYRRDDTADVAGRIYDAMAQRFGKNRVFKDVDNIGPGVDFGDYIKSVLPKCRVALMLIGPHWLESKDEDGRPRLEDEHDWVRIEIETALTTPGVLVVPVLVNGARMPRASEVPATLQPLLRRNAAMIRRDPDFHDDVERLATALRASVSTGILDLSKLGGERGAPQAPRVAPARRGPGMAVGVAVGVVLAAAVAAVAIWGPWRTAPPTTSETATTTATTLAEAPGPALSPSPTTTATTMPPRPQLPQTTTTATVQPVPAGDIPLPQMVRIPGRNFEVGRYEVTFTQWDACVAAGGCNGYRPRDYGWGRGSRPVINVSWHDAQAYVQWLSQRTGQRFRLLTEAEWEFAARAGSTAEYSWGDQAPVCDENARNGAIFAACTDDRTRPVGSFQPNAFGLYDVHGNVAEWLEDCYDSGCSSRVLRGGNWGQTAVGLSFSSRWREMPDSRGAGGNGFRVARTI